jgi:predicted nuclease of predicted toxin-antitoxin system
MLLLIDECVPTSVTEFFRERGHEVWHVTDTLLPGTPDQVVAKIGDQYSAIVVTWNAKDFKRLAARIPEGNQQRFRHLGRINFRCRESRGRQRAEAMIEAIEFHFAFAQRQGDKRLLLDITETTFTVR